MISFMISYYYCLIVLDAVVHINALNSHNAKRKASLCSIFTQGPVFSERLSDFSKVTQLVNGKPKN
jgi:hypothetical protein